MKGKLLVIDNEPFDREVMAKVFSQYYDIVFAEHPAECSDALIKFQPDVVLFELRVPKLGLLEMVCEAVKSCNPSIPMLVSVSYNNIELERYAREHKIFYFMIRPFNYKELCEALEAAFVRAGVGKETSKCC